MTLTPFSVSSPYIPLSFDQNLGIPPTPHRWLYLYMAQNLNQRRYCDKSSLHVHMWVFGECVVTWVACDYHYIQWGQQWNYLPSSWLSWYFIRRTRGMVSRVITAAIFDWAKKKWAPGWVNFASAVDYHFYLNLPEKYLLPGAHFLVQPYICPI